METGIGAERENGRARRRNRRLMREILGMVEYPVEYGYFRKDRDLAWSRQVDPSCLTWE